MSCSNRIWLTLLFIGIGLSAMGNVLLPHTIGSQLILIGFLCIMLVLLGKLTPWVFFYKENSAGRSSRRLSDHPERLPIISRFPNGDFLVAVKEKRFRMWRTDLDEVYCQEVSIETGHNIGQRISSSSQASSLGIPSEIYKRLEQNIRIESKFL